MGEVGAQIRWVIEPFGRVGGTKNEAVVLIARHATRLAQDCLGIGAVRDDFPLIRNDPLPTKAALYFSVNHRPFGVAVSIQFARVKCFRATIELIRIQPGGGRHEYSPANIRPVTRPLINYRLGTRTTQVHARHDARVSDSTVGIKAICFEPPTLDCVKHCRDLIHSHRCWLRDDLLLGSIPT